MDLYQNILRRYTEILLDYLFVRLKSVNRDFNHFLRFFASFLDQELEQLKEENRELYEELMELRKKIKVGNYLVNGISSLFSSKRGYFMEMLMFAIKSVLKLKHSQVCEYSCVVSLPAIYRGIRERLVRPETSHHGLLHVRSQRLSSLDSSNCHCCLSPSVRRVQMVCALFSFIASSRLSLLSGHHLRDAPSGSD